VADGRWSIFDEEQTWAQNNTASESLA
jgi:hypothetical protein